MIGLSCEELGTLQNRKRTYKQNRNRAKIHQKHRKSYLFSIFALFLRLFEGCCFFFLWVGASLSQGLRLTGAERTEAPRARQLFWDRGNEEPAWSRRGSRKSIILRTLALPRLNHLETPTSSSMAASGTIGLSHFPAMGLELSGLLFLLIPGERCT